MLKGINNKLILEIEGGELTTNSGIIVNNCNNETQNIGKIIAISEEIEKEKKVIKIGKKVIFEKKSSIEINYNEKKYFVLDIKDILAIIEE